MTMDFTTIRSAAQKGDIEAQLLLGLSYFTGQIATIKNLEQSFIWLKLAADAGLKSAQYVLAHLYENGIGTTENKKEAFKYTKLASDADFQPAKINLALYYEHGIGIDKDITKAEKMLQALAKAGDSSAATYLGLKYQDGFNGEPDSEKSIQWLTVSANLNNPVGCFHLARYYDNLNPSQAIALYEKAAHLGSQASCQVLAITYSKGLRNTEMDLSKAKYFSDLAGTCRNEILEFSLQKAATR